jgi:hypothetical protein
MEEAATTEPPPEPTAEPAAEPTEAAAPPAPEAAATPEEEAGGPAPAPASQPPAPTHADAAVAVAPHALGCVFFGLLLHRLNEKELAWPIVFAPLFAADAITFVRRLLDARQASAALAASDATGAALAAKTLDKLRPTCAAVDAVGACAAKVLIVLLLCEEVNWTVATILIPFWAATVVSALLRGRCFVLRRDVDRAARQAELGRRARRHGHNLHGPVGMPPAADAQAHVPTLDEVLDGPCEAWARACAFTQGAFLHGVGRALQPALVSAKLDGALEARWGLIFAPAWALLAALAGVAATLCNCAPVLSAGMPPRVRRRAVRLVSLCATQLLVLSGCTFLCLLRLSKRLDADEAAARRFHDRWDRRDCDELISSSNVTTYESLCAPLSKDGPRSPTPLDILGPLILMYALLFILHPIVLRDSRRFQRVVQIVVVDADDLEAQRRARGAGFDVFLGAPASLVGVQDNSVIIEALENPTRLLKTSSTLYERMEADSPKQTQIAHCAPAPAAWDEESVGSSRFGDDDLEIAEAPAPSPSHLCYVCCVSRKNAVIMECGHGGICFECGKSLASRHPRNCPICRAPISAVLRVERREPGSPHVFSPEGVVVQPRRS